MAIPVIMPAQPQFYGRKIPNDRLAVCRDTTNEYWCCAGRTLPCMPPTTAARPAIWVFPAACSCGDYQPEFGTSEGVRSCQCAVPRSIWPMKVRTFCDIAQPMPMHIPHRNHSIALCIQLSILSTPTIPARARGSRKQLNVRPGDELFNTFADFVG